MDGERSVRGAVWDALHDPSVVPRGWYDPTAAMVGGTVGGVPIDRASWGRDPEAIANMAALKAMAGGPRNRPDAEAVVYADEEMLPPSPDALPE